MFVAAVQRPGGSRACESSTLACLLGPVAPKLVCDTAQSSLLVERHNRVADDVSTLPDLGLVHHQRGCKSAAAGAASASNLTAQAAATPRAMPHVVMMSSNELYASKSVQAEAGGYQPLLATRVGGSADSLFADIKLWLSGCVERVLHVPTEGKPNSTASCRQCASTCSLHACAQCPFSPCLGTRQMATHQQPQRGYLSCGDALTAQHASEWPRYCTGGARSETRLGM